jgi:hypothetical protein
MADPGNNSIVLYRIMDIIQSYYLVARRCSHILASPSETAGTLTAGKIAFSFAESYRVFDSIVFFDSLVLKAFHALAASRL